jgi:hypothetical protein
VGEADLVELRDVISWTGFAIRAIVSVGVIVVALVAVRPRLPRAGWTLAAAALVETVLACASRFAYRAVPQLELEPGAVERAYSALICAGTAQTLIEGALIIAVVALLGREGRDAPRR